jgi:hypothetical protein
MVGTVEKLWSEGRHIHEMKGVIRSKKYVEKTKNSIQGHGVMAKKTEERRLPKTDSDTGLIKREYSREGDFHA